MRKPDEELPVTDFVSKCNTIFNIFYYQKEHMAHRFFHSFFKLKTVFCRLLLIVSDVVPIRRHSCFQGNLFLRFPLQIKSCLSFKLSVKILSFSFSIIFSSTGTVSGSIYTLSAISLSVIIVAGLEFTSTTSKPSSFKERRPVFLRSQTPAACPITIGPEPITKTFLILGSLGILLHLHHLNKFVKQSVRITVDPGHASGWN